MPYQQVQTIQKTSKIWKFFQAISLLAAMASAVLFVIGTTRMGDGGDKVNWLLPVGLFGLIASIIAYIFSRLCAWWSHG